MYGWDKNITNRTAERLRGKHGLDIHRRVSKHPHMYKDNMRTDIQTCVCRAYQRIDQVKYVSFIPLRTAYSADSCRQEKCRDRLARSRVELHLDSVSKLSLELKL